MKKAICRFLVIFLTITLQISSFLASAQTIQPNQADDNGSINQCYDRLKEAFEKRRVPTPDPFCLLTTDDGIQIESSANRKNSPPSGLLASDISEFFKMYMDNKSRFAEVKTKEVQVRTVDTDRVFKIYSVYRDEDGEVLDSDDKSIGGGPEYAVLGASSMYWIRCNAGRDDHCVVYTNLFGRKSPDGSRSAPGGLPWPSHQSPCYFFMKHSFRELGGGTGLPGVVDTVEALMQKMHEDPDTPAIYERLCNWRQKVK